MIEEFTAEHRAQGALSERALRRVAQLADDADLPASRSSQLPSPST
jgi:hypothetical protein